ncbi:MAG: tyrosine-protein phosphatase, partial [Candidatus Limnocylindria bacterium]
MAEPARSRHLDWEGCLNLRDLGGHPTEDGGETAWGAFVRGDTVCALTDAGRSSLRDYGIRTILDLRSASELEREPNPFANVPEEVAYLHRPLNDPSVAERIGAMPKGADRYVAMAEAGGARIAGILRAMAAAPAGGILFHCFAGRDRTG